jgi:acetyltransferase-like isoleucine patch superfamily enzyme
MKHELHAALGRNPVGSRALGFRRRLVDASAPVRNRLFGCRLKARGADNLVVWSLAQRIRATSITIVGDGNTVVFGRGARIESSSIAVRGSGNRIVVGSSSLSGSAVTVSGDANTVDIGDDCTLLGLSVVCEDDGNCISIGASTQVHGTTELAAMEGTRIGIGTGCLFSGGIHFRTGDSHALTDLEGRRINPSRDIAVGDHVWVGMNVVVLKGTAVADSSVLGACSVLSGRFDKPNCIIAGNPARLVREGIDWRVER